MNSNSCYAFLIVTAFTNSIVSAQPYDFFFSVSKSNAVNADISEVFEVGESGSLFIYYSTNGPANSDLNIGAFLDIANTNGVLHFTRAETFDFPYSVGNIKVGNRWTAFGETATVSNNFINELGAFQMHLGDGILEQNNGDRLFLDHGYNTKADAFLFGKIDFIVIEEGVTNIQMSAGRGLVVHSENPNGTCAGRSLDVAFGCALITTPLGVGAGPNSHGADNGGVPDGDLNGDGSTNLLDIDPFVQLLASGDYDFNADFDLDGKITLLDVAGFIELILTPEPKLGDVDCNGTIDLLDVSCLRVLLIDSETPCELSTSDINGDGQIDLLDVIPMIDIVLDQE